MNKKKEKIIKLWERGITDFAVIARKLGYTGNSIQSGIERVKEGLRAKGIKV